jgi:hypothetical protein
MEFAMTEGNYIRALVDFSDAIGHGAGPDAPWRALQVFTDAVVGAKLFTVMTLDMKAGVAGRVYTSHPVEYPVSGTKPIHYDDWFELIHKQRRPFIANTIEDIAKVFPDHETIRSLGCGSVINLPLEIAGEVVGTINLLDAEHYYTPLRIEQAALLSLPAKTAYLAAAYGR